MVGRYAVDTQFLELALALRHIDCPGEYLSVSVLDGLDCQPRHYLVSDGRTGNHNQSHMKPVCPRLKHQADGQGKRAWRIVKPTTGGLVLRTTSKL